jgi:hypothetical protein
VFSRRVVACCSTSVRRLRAALAQFVRRCCSCSSSLLIIEAVDLVVVDMTRDNSIDWQLLETVRRSTPNQHDLGRAKTRGCDSVLYGTMAREGG